MTVRCSVCTRDDAILRVVLSDGCLAFPDVNEQDLCLQHYHSIQPRGTLEVAEVYEPEVLLWYHRTRGDV